LGFNRSQIYRWLALYREGGYEALKKSVAKGREPKLSDQQLQKLHDIITSKNPTQLNFEFALWTRAMVRELIQDEFQVKLSDVSVGRLLRKLGLSPQRPLRKACQQNPDRVEEWKTIAYPEIQKEAKKVGADIYFGDESCIRSDHHSGTAWAPVGETPIIERTGARFSINMISAINPKGHQRFMAFTSSMNSDKFIEFLKRLMTNAEKPIFLILDGHRVHTSKKVKEFVIKTQGMLRLFILPPYSPQLNPDEWVWNWLKNHKIGKFSIKGPDQFCEQVKKFMCQLQKSKNILLGFFKDKNLEYIADAT
ncbi:IS630 family transposase, partial [Marinibactrum halimedae]